jgi:protein arginine N-methyltransferase 3
MAAIPQQKDDLTSDSSISDRDEGEWEDAEPDEESIEVVSLFDDTVFGNAKTMLDYCKERYNFDFISIQKQHS